MIALVNTAILAAVAAHWTAWDCYHDMTADGTSHDDARRIADAVQHNLLAGHSDLTTRGDKTTFAMAWRQCEANDANEAVLAALDDDLDLDGLESAYESPAAAQRRLAASPGWRDLCADLDRKARARHYVETTAHRVDPFPTDDDILFASF